MQLLESLLKSLCEPPLCLLLVAAFGALLQRGWPRIGRALVVAALGLLLLLSMPVVGGSLLRSLQTEPPIEALTLARPTAGAIVVLGAGVSREAAEYGGESVGPFTLERVRYAAWLHHKTRLPVLVSGGRPGQRQPSTSQLMADVLRQEFSVPVLWVEGRSLDTRENARESAEMLRSAGIEEILLVTHAWHMPRSLRAFEAEGLRVQPAPTGFRAAVTFEAAEWLPGWKGLRDSTLACHEWLGRIWYALARS